MPNPAGWEGHLQGLGTERTTSLRRKVPKSKAKATVITRCGMGVEQDIMTPWILEQPHAGQRKGKGPQDNPDTLSKKSPHLFNTNPP